MGQDVSLKWQLALEDRQRIPDGSGGYSESWVPLGTVWAHVQARGVSATEVSAGSTTLVRYKITVRGAPEGSPKRIKTGQRFRNGSKVYTVDSVSESDATGLYLVCSARKEVLA